MQSGSQCPLQLKQQEGETRYCRKCTDGKACLCAFKWAGGNNQHRFNKKRLAQTGLKMECCKQHRSEKAERAACANGAAHQPRWDAQKKSKASTTQMLASPTPPSASSVASCQTSVQTTSLQSGHRNLGYHPERPSARHPCDSDM